MVLKQHRRGAADRLDDRPADLLAADERKAAARNWAAKLVRHRREHAGNGLASDGKRRGIARVCVDHAAHVRAGAIDVQVALRIKGRLERALDDPAVQVQHHHLFRAQVLASARRRAS